MNYCVLNRQKVASYAKETNSLFIMLLKAVVESLGLVDDDDITKEFGNGSQLMVINCFPSCPEPDLTLGMPPHSDYGFLTLLLQDGVRGLQIQSQGEWVTVDPLPNSFVVNVGDHLEVGISDVGSMAPPFLSKQVVCLKQVIC